MDYLKEALQKYGFSECKSELIRHNENMTYKVTAEAGEYLLRIHKPREGFLLQQRFESLDLYELRVTELEFIKHLNENGIKVQTPICNKEGELVTRLADGTLVTVLTWVEGRTISDTDLSTKLCMDIGEMAYKLHKAARTFKANAFSYDSLMLNKMISRIEECVKNEVIDEKYAIDIYRAIATIRDIYEERKEANILIHADLSMSNILITDSGLVPIDFSMAGYCNPMFDIGLLLAGFSNPILGRAIEKGYQQAGGTIDSMAVDCGFALGVLASIDIFIEDWAKHDWFKPRLIRWCEELFKPLYDKQEDVAKVSTIKVENARIEDVDKWLDLVRLCEEHFPGLDIEDYRKTLIKNIERQSAICVKNADKLAGVLLYSVNRMCLSFMLVHKDSRGVGVAGALIKEMIRRMPEGDITVTTYREDDRMGKEARALYKKAGFVPGELIEEFGYPVQVYVLHK